MNQAQPPADAGAHPLVLAAARAFEQGRGTLDDEVLSKLTAELEELATSPELGPAVNGLVQLAAHLDKDLGNQAAADALLQVALSASSALQLQNKKGKQAQQDAQRKRNQAFQGFSGNAPRPPAPTLDQKKPEGVVSARSLNVPTKFK